MIPFYPQFSYTPRATPSTTDNGTLSHGFADTPPIVMARELARCRPGTWQGGQQALALINWSREFLFSQEFAKIDQRFSLNFGGRITLEKVS
jgi:hypothetical protein